MPYVRVSAALAAALSSVMLASCGGKPPAQPDTVQSAEPAPEPTPTPEPPAPPPYSVVPPCPLAPSNPGGSAVCNDPESQLRYDVNAAIDAVVERRPDLFDPGDTTGWGKVVNYNGYMKAVAAALRDRGLCGHIEPEGEMGVKRSNKFSEQWIIINSGSYVRRFYVGGCTPATF